MLNDLELTLLIAQVNTYFSWSDVSAADRYAEGLEAFVHAGNNVA